MSRSDRSKIVEKVEADLKAVEAVKVIVAGLWVDEEKRSRASHLAEMLGHQFLSLKALGENLQLDLNDARDCLAHEEDAS